MSYRRGWAKHFCIKGEREQSILPKRWGKTVFNRMGRGTTFYTEVGDTCFFTDIRGDKHFMLEMVVMMMLMVGGGSRM